MTQKQKNILWIVTILIALGLTYLLYKENQSLPPLTTIDSTATTTGSATILTFHSADKTISFDYPTLLSVTEKNNIITLEHQINYSGPDACDMQGATSTAPVKQTMSSTLTDFHVTIQTYNLNIASTAQAVSPSLPQSSFQDNTLKISSGFIDPYNNGVWNGYMISEGAEGCGQVTYYIPLSSSISPSRTLVIQKILVGALSDVADPTNKQNILNTPGVISTDQSNQILSAIVNSLQAK